MRISTITLGVIAFGLGLYAWRRGDDSLRRGIAQGWHTFHRNGLLLALAFIILGYVNVLAPQELVRTCLGPGSGWRGLLLAEGIGMLLPGGPYVVFPLIGVLYEAGAGLGPTVVLVTSWATQALLSVAFELPFMGWRFAALRWGLGLICPLMAGYTTQIIFGG